MVSMISVFLFIRNNYRKKTENLLKKMKGAAQQGFLQQPSVAQKVARSALKGVIMRKRSMMGGRTCTT